MKVSAWISVSDLVSIKQTSFEKIIERFDKKANMFQSLSHAEIFHSLKKSGVNGVELLINKYASDQNISQIKKLLSKQNMPILSIHQSLSHKRNISLGTIERLCKIANMLGVSVIVLHSETLGQKLLDETFVNKLKELQKRYTVSFGIENMSKTFLTRDEFVFNGNEFASLMGKNGLSITFDTTHLAQVGEDILQFYLTNKKKIINIHLSDYKKNWVNKYLISQVGAHLPLGQGELPMRQFIRLLKRENYNGLITLEINAGLEQLCNSARLVRKYLL